MPFLRDLHDALERCGLDVLQLDHEDAHGQYEVNFAFADVLATADHLMLFKLAAQAIAERHDMLFSMMPKPFANQPGSGMHCHVSLWQGQKDDTRNVFVPHRADGSIDTAATLSAIGPAVRRRRAGARAGTDRAGRADRQLLQAADRRRVAVRHDLGPRLCGVRPEQPHRARAHACTAASSGVRPMPAPTRT